MDSKAMIENSAAWALAAFHRAAEHVPAYQKLLEEAGVRPGDVTRLQDFVKLPVLDKRNTFQRFDVADLCLDRRLGQLESVLTSSGHSGIFSFGLTARGGPSAAAWTDNALDPVFQVKSKPTLLINCLPMGVKLATLACTLAETSVRPDMAIGLVRAFGRHFDQIIMVGEPAFLKFLLELGRAGGMKWEKHTVHLITGEEPLAENARKYLEGLLGTDQSHPGKGLVASSMGVAELGLNLFFEAPPGRAIIQLRRWLHQHPEARAQVFGTVDTVPCIFAYDPRRIFVEFDRDRRLLLTTLDPETNLPLIRYATGDVGGFLALPEKVRTQIHAAGISWTELTSLPLVALEGRGDFAEARGQRLSPEAVKEGIYHDPVLAILTTANFRLISGPDHVHVRIQLSPGVKPAARMGKDFAAALRHYSKAPIEVTCEG